GRVEMEVLEHAHRLLAAPESLVDPAQLDDGRRRRRRGPVRTLLLLTRVIVFRFNGHQSFFSSIACPSRRSPGGLATILVPGVGPQRTTKLSPSLPSS